MKKVDPFERLKNLLSLSSVESYQPQTNRIQGEAFLKKYIVNSSGVITNPDRLYGVSDTHTRKSFRDRMHIQILGAETNKGRWAISVSYLLKNSGGGGLPCTRELYKRVQAFASVKDAIIYKSVHLIEVCDRENSGIARSFKKKLIAYRDELLINNNV